GGVDPPGCTRVTSRGPRSPCSAPTPAAGPRRCPRFLSPTIPSARSLRRSLRSRRRGAVLWSRAQLRCSLLRSQRAVADRVLARRLQRQRTRQFLVLVERSVLTRGF